MRLVAEQVIRLQGKPTTPARFYRDMRTMALDGFVVDVPDTPTNQRAFGRPGSGRAPAAFPRPASCPCARPAAMSCGGP